MRLDDQGRIRPGLTPDRAADISWTLCGQANFPALVPERVGPTGSTHVPRLALDGFRLDWLEIIGQRIIPEMSRF